MINEINSIRDSSQKQYIGQPKYVKIIVILSILSAFVGHITIYDYFVVTVWMCAAFYLCATEDFWVLFIPLSIFDNTIFFYFTNYTVFKILVLIAIAKLLLERNTSIKLNRYVVLFCLLAGYVLLNLRGYLPGIISITICILTMLMICITCYKFREPEFFRRAMFGFAIFAVAAGVYGLLHGNTRSVSASGEILLRFCGTSSDPNTMGYKFVIGVVAIVFTDIIKSKTIKIFCVVFLLYAIFKTASTTAIVALCIFAITVVLLQKSSLKKVVCVISAAIFVIFFVTNIETILVYFADKDILGINTERLLSQYLSFSAGDYSDATSLRTEIWTGYMEYFTDKQSIWRQLFGGNVSNIYGIEKNFAGMSWDAAAHNTNIDILMSVGIVGLVVVYACSFLNLKNDYWALKKNPKSINMMRITIKILTIFYAFSLSSFLSYGFMIFLV